jgi:PAS domain S-box-containing protein
MYVLGEPSASTVSVLESMATERDAFHVAFVTDVDRVRDQLSRGAVDCLLCTRSFLTESSDGVRTLVEETAVPVAIFDGDETNVALSLAQSSLDRNRQDSVYETIVDTAPMPAFIHTDDGTIRYANDALADLVDADDTDAVVGETSLSFVAPDDRETARDRMGRLFDDRELLSEQIEYRIDVPSGTKHVLVSAVPIPYGGRDAGLLIVNDITDREAQKRLLETERDRFTALFESVPNPVVHVEHPAGNLNPIVRNANDAFEEVFGYQSGTMSGEPLNEYVGPDRAREEARRIDERVSALEPIEREVRRRTTEGERTFLLQSIPFREGESGVVESLAIYTDITEQKRREERLRRQNERLEEFASIVSHDLRNPLNVANGYLELLQADYDDERFEKLGDALGRMDDLIEKLLAMARQGQVVDETDSVDVATVAERAWSNVVTDEIDHVVDVSLTVAADVERLVQMFENLFRNALEHATSGNGSDLTVTVGPLADDGGAPVGFYVADDGVGIDAKNHEKVFDSGYSTTDGGTGLGLNIVEQLAEAHGWSVAVTESEAGGARFEFRGVDVV